MGSIRSRADNHKLFMDFRFDGQRCREQTALDDTPANRKKLEKVLQRIEHGTFDYARFFPNSKMARKFGGASAGVAQAPSPASGEEAMPEIAPPVSLPAPVMPAALPAPVIFRPTFAEFSKDWMQENEVAWRRSYRRTVADIVTKHLTPASGSGRSEASLGKNSSNCGPNSPKSPAARKKPSHRAGSTPS